MSGPAAPDGPLRVLICDDNEMLRAALAEVVGAQPDLALAGSAADAEEAIRLATAEQPHVVVLDVRFPGGGPHTARQITRAVPGVRILVFSAYGDQATRSEMAAVGVADYLVKGTTNARLLAGIRALGAEARSATTSGDRAGGTPDGLRTPRE
ncbi:response regulator [Actinacidiphila paucisporea]|uniref:Two-component system, NarL family, response regulator LiaR n=1 Tax=Actinacidiphila paucisporea TaxID=310782 RepID=A0A1M7P0C7_9ACTN|nr:response regulator transcription factor [Actinacidiphila paucisporea]SHN09569.1 two-component system, NarL family, response regulator LiaR [Actinacidiphila paucisporea]